MTKYKDLIESKQRTGERKEDNSCILRNDLSSYCAHPLTNEHIIKCDYGLTEIKVPRDCPLRRKSLTIKLIHEN